MALPELDPSLFEPGVREITQNRLQQFETERAQLGGSELAQAWRELGMFFQAQDLDAAAGVAYHNGLHLLPDDPRLNYFHGVLADKQGDFIRAAEAFAKARPYPAANLRQGQALLGANELEAAVQVLESGLEALGRRPAFLAALGEVYLRMQRPAQAKAVLEESLKQAPQADRLHYLLALAERNLGNVEAARAHMAQRGDVRPPAEDPWMAQMRRLTADSDDFFTRATEAAGKGDFVEAVALFQTAVELAPDEPAYRTALAQAQAYTGDTDGSLQTSRTVLQRWPEHTEAYFQLALAYEIAGDEERAQEFYEAAWRSGDYPKAGLRRAASLLRTGDSDAAVTLYEDIVEQFPQALEARVALGRLRLAAGDCEAGLERLRTTVAAAPADQAASRALVRGLSICPVSTLAKRDALQAARALQAHQASAENNAVLAMALAANGQFKTATRAQLAAISAALESGNAAWLTELNQDLERYQASQLPPRAYPPDSSLLRPPPLTPGS